MLICFTDWIIVIMNMYPVSVQILTYVANVMGLVVIVIKLFRFNFDFFGFFYLCYVCVLFFSLFSNCFFFKQTGSTS